MITKLVAWSNCPSLPSDEYW